MVDPNILPASVYAHSETLLRLGQIYKQINAPLRSFGPQHADGLQLRDAKQLGRRRSLLTLWKIRLRHGPRSVMRWLRRSRRYWKERSSVDWEQ